MAIHLLPTETPFASEPLPPVRPDAPPRSALDKALDLWLGRSQTLSRITWNLAACLLAIGLVAAALGLIDWSPAFVALLPERAHELIKLTRKAVAASGP
ncbi:MAG: hypothetical protein JF588_12660 [Caulobacterales bacterium]|nr:hypothetical protein [Caulobacterales bacterium]